MVQDGSKRTLYTDRNTFLRTGKDRSSIAPIVFSLFFIAGIAADIILWGGDPLILSVGIVGLAAQIVSLYLIRKNHRGHFEIDERGIRFPRPRDTYIEFSKIKGFKTEDKQQFLFHTRYMEIRCDDGSNYVISNKKLRPSDYITADFVRIETSIRDRWNQLNR
jgi:hypothetical protein